MALSRQPRETRCSTAPLYTPMMRMYSNGAPMMMQAHDIAVLSSALSKHCALFSGNGSTHSGARTPSGGTCGDMDQSHEQPTTPQKNTAPFINEEPTTLGKTTWPPSEKSLAPSDRSGILGHWIEKPYVQTGVASRLLCLQAREPFETSRSNPAEQPTWLLFHWSSGGDAPAGNGGVRAPIE